MYTHQKQKSVTHIKGLLLLMWSLGLPNCASSAVCIHVYIYVCVCMCVPCTSRKICTDTDASSVCTHMTWKTADEQKLNNKSSKKNLTRTATHTSLANTKMLKAKLLSYHVGLLLQQLWEHCLVHSITYRWKFVLVCAHGLALYIHKRSGERERAITHTCTKHNINLCKPRVHPVVQLLCAPLYFLRVINGDKSWCFVTPFWGRPKFYLVHFTINSGFDPMFDLPVFYITLQLPDVQAGFVLASSCVQENKHKNLTQTMYKTNEHIHVQQ